jgi:hypothetical protein
VLYYSFAAFLLPMQHSLSYSQTALTGAFSVSVLVTGAAAVPAGAWLDCCGARGLMTAGSLLAAVAVLFVAYLRQGGYPLAVASAAAGALGFVQIAGRVVLTVLARRMSTAVAAAVLLAAQVAGWPCCCWSAAWPGSWPSSSCSGWDSACSASPARTCSPSTPLAACTRG